MDNSKKDFDTRLSGLREGIDKIDDTLLELINKRLELVREVGRLKAEKGRQVLDSSREARIFKRLLAKNTGPLNEKVLRHLFTQIMAASKQLQKPHRVAYLGPEATFTHIAAINHFGQSVEYVPQPAIRDVFNEVERGTCHYGVVPVENSIEGAINHTLDLFFESDIKICAERYQPVSYDLLSDCGRIKDIKRIYATSHSFALCRLWTEKYLPSIKRKECRSTAIAVKKAREKKDSAVIAGSEASHLVKLEPIASRIEDIPKNMNRFLVIGRDKITGTGKDKTSVMFVTSHIPGALYKTLKPIAENGLNMVKLESRPAKYQNWSYFFFADIEGHIDEPVMQKTISQMEKVCLYMKCLGSYPIAMEEKSGVHRF